GRRSPPIQCSLHPHWQTIKNHLHDRYRRDLRCIIASSCAQEKLSKKWVHDPVGTYARKTPSPRTTAGMECQRLRDAGCQSGQGYTACGSTNPSVSLLL